MLCNFTPKRILNPVTGATRTSIVGNSHDASFRQGVDLGEREALSGHRQVSRRMADTDQLSWNADNIAQLMFKHKIRSRGALAKELGVSRSTVNDSFNDDWRGRATSRLINLLAPIPFT
jgi:hypothetical protein